MRTDTTVHDVMHREFLGVSESDALPEAAALLVEEETNCLVVVRGGEPVGRLEARDALEVLLEAGDGGESPEGPPSTVGAAMSPPLPTVSPDDSLAALEERLVAEGTDRVVAVDDGEAVGVVTDGDALAAGAPRTGAGADGFGDEPATGDPHPEETVLSTAAAADSDAERSAAATMDPATASEPAAAASGDGPSGSEDGVDPVTGAPSEGSTQGVCESCGALVPDLVTANGQAVCPNCREV
ncbi:CBS domain-containing protein [Halorubrum ezzemoulense]|jgi:CBS domain-containing protein|uniref:CBS domain-containing protein n=1 Tax=Halorubrum ezzemoulense TaxID=337243 RepID=A0A238XQT8_HALEZ|nr:MULTISPECIES: CBS domain-containing protein [Halorubrum]MDB2264521.1 CBS domain-containing protein [Halorubrum ezzemoulense]MDB2280341.1 CBS domain-containing protein [Halorubrum ezzemoulense]MDB9249983.1 CBS domain-containing protein [Halorubrum ezzemoulense]MDB9260008.1 CBS domain-containing protein [Halorubrum ezzemoulense]MDB9263445.1 CBS domain-containing protein [Halorubrum ezzemoulense]